MATINTANQAGTGKGNLLPAAILHAMRSFRLNVVIARPFQNYFLGSMSKTSANHTALDVSCNKFQKIVIGVFMVHFCHNLTF